MFSSNLHDRTILETSQGDYIAITAESFLIDRQAEGVLKYTLKFYRQFLNPFLAFCNAHSLTLVGEVTADFLRRYLLTFAETHNREGYMPLSEP